MWERLRPLPFVPSSDALARSGLRVQLISNEPDTFATSYTRSTCRCHKGLVRGRVVSLLEHIVIPAAEEFGPDLVRRSAPDFLTFRAASHGSLHWSL